MNSTLSDRKIIEVFTGAPIPPRFKLGLSCSGRRKLNILSMFRNKSDAPKIGDRYVSVGREAINWEVELVFQDPNRIPHARLRRIDNVAIQRTFSLAALTDPELFRRQENTAS